MSEFETEEVAGIYDDLVDTYELEWNRRGHRSLHLEYYDEEHQEPGAASINTMRLLSEAAGIGAGERVLVVGCGAGEDVVWNARAHEATVTGVDISERLLDLARENARAHGVDDQVSFARDDFHELSTIADDSMDVVWGLEAFSHSPDRRRVLEQAHRVLVADGRVAVADIFLRGPTDDNRVREIEDALGLHLGPIASFEEALGETGFGTVAVEDATDGIRPCTARRRRFARPAHLLGRILGPLGVLSKTQLDAFRASSLLHELVEEDLVGYYVVTAERT